MSPIAPAGQGDLDSRIIDVLSLNGQMPARQIARYLNLPEDRVRQRLTTMLSEGHLAVQAIVDLTAAGFEFYMWYFVQVEGAPVTQVATELASIPEVIIVSIVLGPYDLVVGVLAQNREHLVELTKKVGMVEGIRQLDCALALDIRKFDANYRRRIHDGFPRILDIVPQVPGFDTVDSMIILELRKDGRSSNYHLARQIGLSEGAVRHRIKRLIERKSIRIVPLFENSGLPSVVSYIGIRADRRVLDDIMVQLVRLPNVPFVTESVGSFDIILLSRADSRPEFLSLLIDKVRAIPGVRRTETLELISLIKWDSDWMKILNSNSQRDIAEYARDSYGSSLPPSEDAQTFIT